MRMERALIAGLLEPFLGGSRLSDAQLEQLRAYLDLLLRWNARVNLTSVREPDSIVTRHFGESLFLARRVFPAPSDRAKDRVLDLGSGPGFPGLPVKIYAPGIRLTLVESNHKKAAFLREAIRTVGLDAVDVFAGRGEELPTCSANRTALTGYPPSLLTMRAVEKFDQALALAERLVRPEGRLALLVGAEQARRLSSSFTRVRWEKSVAIPQSERRVVLIGRVEPG